MKDIRFGILAIFLSIVATNCALSLNSQLCLTGGHSCPPNFDSGDDDTPPVVTKTRPPNSNIPVDTVQSSKSSSWTLFGCPPVTLSAKGKNVNFVVNTTPPKECTLLGPVEANLYPGMQFGEVKNLVRNFAGQLQADYVILENYDPGAFALGRAYRCGPEPKTIVSNNSTQSSRVEALRSPSFRTSDLGMVFDEANNMAWQTCSSGMTFEQGQCSGVKQSLNLNQAAEYCNSLNLGGYRWRLPKREEAQLLVNPTAKRPPYSDENLFPNSPEDALWTVSDYDRSPNAVWVVDFRDAQTYGYGVENRAFARCVANR